MNDADLRSIKVTLEKRLKECEVSLSGYKKMQSYVEGKIMDLSAAISVIDLELSGIDESDQL